MDGVGFGGGGVGLEVEVAGEVLLEEKQRQSLA